MGFTSAYLCWLSFLVVCFLLLFIQVGYKIDACSGPSPPTPRHGGVPNPITAGGQSRKLGSNLIIKSSVRCFSDRGLRERENRHLHHLSAISQTRGLHVLDLTNLKRPQAGHTEIYPDKSNQARKTKKNPMNCARKHTPGRS
jgi:hypothetical protein